MKTSKILLTSALFALFSVCSFAQEPTVVTLVSSKNIKDASELVVDLDGEIITDTWSKNPIVRIEMEIKADDLSKEVVKHLITKRRFYIKTMVLENGIAKIYMPNLKIPVYINGRLLSEDISYRILVPENVLVRVKTFDDIKS